MSAYTELIAPAFRAAVQSVRGALSSSSTSVRARHVSGTHHLRIGGYSQIDKTYPPGKHVSSDLFSVGSHRWSLNVYPNGSGFIGHSGHFSTWLSHLGSPKPITEYTVSILDRDKVPAFSFSVGPITFGRDLLETSRDNLVTVEELRRSCSGSWTMTTASMSGAMSPCSNVKKNVLSGGSFDSC